MERCADGTGGGVELAHHALDLLAQSGFVEVEAEDVLAREELAQGAPVLIGLAHFEWGDDGHQLVEHGVGRRTEGTAVVVDALQIAGVAGKGEGDEHEVRKTSRKTVLHPCDRLGHRHNF